MVLMETKSELIALIADQAARVAQRFAQDDEDERAYMRKRCSPQAQLALDKMSVEALHLLDAIPGGGSTDEPSVNIVGLAQATGVPKGTVSKRVQRLTDIGVVTRHQIPGNRKEVHLRRTPIGDEIWEAHRSLHEQMGDVLGELLSRYTVADLQVLTRVLDDLLRMPREGLRYRPDLLD